MPGFLYYIPGQSGRMEIETARSLPCAYAFGDCKSVDSRGVLHGPEEQPAGLIIARPGTIPDADMGLFLDRQKWVKMKQSDIWIGWNSQATDAVPPPLKPVDLARPRQIDGRALELGDGNEWLIPVARRLKIQGEDVIPYCALPMVSKLQDDGTWSPSGVRAKFQELWKITCEYLAAYMSGREEGGRWFFDFEYSRMHDCACLAIGTNYYLGRDEIAILELLDNEMAQRIMNELGDLSTFEEFASSKKNDLPPAS